jgi:hypothetical protein
MCLMSRKSAGRFWTPLQLHRRAVQGVDEAEFVFGGPLASPANPDLWLGSRGQRFGSEGLSRSLRPRAVRAGVRPFRPHR